jgi:hypothetical protein
MKFLHLLVTSSPLDANIVLLEPVLWEALEIKFEMT